MNRLAWSWLAGLLIGAPALASVGQPRIAFYLIDSGAVPGPAVLSIAVQTEREFSCSGYTLPTSVSLKGSVIDIHIGAVKTTGRICATAMAPARGSASIGALAAGTYRVRIMQGSVVDPYDLTVSAEETELKPQKGNFSISLFQSVHRVAEGAAHVSCVFGLDARCAERARQGIPTCETLFTDPAVTALPPLDARPGPYSQSWFNESGRRYAAPAFETLRPVVSSKRYLDSEGCLFIIVHSGRGESFNNRNP